MRNEAVAEIGGRRVILMDSISLIGEGDAGAVIVCGSHGGAISGAFAALHPPSLVVFNDAGGGKAGAGRASIAMLDARGIACATVSHMTARIGDAEDAWLNGTISAVGKAAEKAGVRTGQSVRQAAEALAPKR
ncbi:hypothetical protein [Marinivivus vitaminiproducens]|uniref:hypothetical protein n=1 Tax=Marinivivus vitaminiproducens TaxID=3035935 RepID=UPI002798D2F1|nr:hypothetical protein P4R82_21345 [Geminicoccaceae bacterium SCSIO 64248]